jgi:beta-glucosidase
VSDVLFAHEGVDFRGTLTFPWPAVPCPAASNRPDPARAPLFAPGYGLHLRDAGVVGTLPESDVTQCGAPTELSIFDKGDAPMFSLQLSADGKEQVVGDRASLDWPQAHPALQVRTAQLATAGDARAITWRAPGSVFSRNPSRNNLSALAQARGALAFDVQVLHAPTRPVRATLGCGAGCGGSVDITPLLAAMPSRHTRTVKVPLACFAQAGADLGGVETPFRLGADAPFAAVIGNVRIVANAASDADAYRCPPRGP